MKKKTVFLILLVTVLFIPIVSVHAEEMNTQTNNTEIETKEQSGWVKEDGETYYYVNGEKVKGFQEIDGNTYFFSQVNSVLKTGVQ